MRKYEMSGTSFGIWFSLLFTAVEETLQIQDVELRLQPDIYRLLPEFAEEWVPLWTSLIEPGSAIPDRLISFSMLSRDFPRQLICEASCFDSLKKSTVIVSPFLVATFLIHFLFALRSPICMSPLRNFTQLRFAFSLRWKIGANTEGSLLQSVEIFPLIPGSCKFARDRAWPF